MATPDWIDALRAYADEHGQKVAGIKIGYSNTVVSAVLKGTYKGDLKTVQQAVEGALLSVKVECPVIGEIPRDRCLENQKAPYAATNPTRVKLYHACPKCPNRRAAS